jgi:hypothetical protein
VLWKRRAGAADAGDETARAPTVAKASEMPVTNNLRMENVSSIFR